ncbi:hypothetical protein Aperf_G00000099661 [Anoplocephala perfoliata]
MKLRDLKFIGKSSPPDGFLDSAAASEPPTDFENPRDSDRHIELEIFVPREESNDDLQLPLEELSSTNSTDSSSEDSSDCESEEKPSTDPLVREISSFEVENDPPASDVENSFGNSSGSNLYHSASVGQKIFDDVDLIKGLLKNIGESSSISDGCSSSEMNTETDLDAVDPESEGRTSKPPVRLLIEETESGRQCEEALVENEPDQISSPTVEVEGDDGCSGCCASRLINFLSFADVPVEISKVSKHSLIEETATSEPIEMDDALAPPSKRAKIENVIDDANT